MSFGDSISDAGAYKVGTIAALAGGKFTVNGPDGLTWTEVLATTVGAPVRALGGGARCVLVRNLGDLNVTPFGLTLDAGTKGLITAMRQAFNSRLKDGLSTSSGALPYAVIVHDDYAQTAAIVADPARYGYTNITTQSCGANAFGNPHGASIVCNTGNLIASDTSRYAFSDSVHPTPFAHQQAAAFAMSLMVSAGWQ